MAKARVLWNKGYILHRPTLPQDELAAELISCVFNRFEK
jgi:hypothetical protein